MSGIISTGITYPRFQITSSNNRLKSKAGFSLLEEARFLCIVTALYFAKAVLLRSRITVTLICPGYSISLSMRPAKS